MSQKSGSVSTCSSRRSSIGSSGAIFSQRIVSADFYTAIPIPAVDLLYSEFRGSEIRRVPVIRVFGATPKGQKTCTHIHGVFPYLYIPFPEGMENIEQRLAFALDKGINSTLSWKPASGTQHVYRIVKVFGRSFYGYKSGDGVFLKIYFYSPSGLKKAEELLQSGNILGRQFQPHETHIPFILQFFMDFRLYGMNFVHFRNIKFRRNGNIPPMSRSTQISSSSSPINLTHWDYSEIPEEFFLSSNVLRKSRCELEIDVMAQDIIVSSSSRGKNPGIEAIWLDEKERRRQHGIEDWANITVPNSQDRPGERETEEGQGHGSYVFPREKELLILLRGRIQIQANSPSPQNQSQEVDDLEPASCTLDQSLSQGSMTYDLDFPLPSVSVEMNEEDEEVIAMLEDMAKERDVVEGDSVIASGNLEGGFFRDLDLDGEDDEEEEADMSQIIEDEDPVDAQGQGQDSDEELKKWSQENLSQSDFDYLEELEKKAIEEFKQKQSPKAGSSKGRGQGQSQGAFKVNQCDGQFDDTSSSSSSTPPPKSKSKSKMTRQKRKLKDKQKSCPPRPRLPLKVRKESSGQGHSGGQGQGPSTSTAASIVDPEKTIVEESEPEEDSDSQDVVYLKTDTPKKKIVPVINVDSSNSLEPPEVEVIEIDDDDSPPPTKDDDSSTASESEFTIVYDTCPVKPTNEPEVKVTVTPMEMEMDQEKEEDTNEELITEGNQSLGITSFYEYSSDEEVEVDKGSQGQRSKEDFQDSHRLSSDDGDLGLGNQSLGITSFYEYESQDEEMEGQGQSPEVEGQGHTSENYPLLLNTSSTSFEEVTSYSQYSNSTTDTDSSEGQGQGQTTPENSQSEFKVRLDRSTAKTRRKRQIEKEERELRRPSIFPATVQPLKNAPSSSDCKIWLEGQERRRKDPPRGKPAQREPEAEEHWMLTYLKCQGRPPPGVMQAKRKFITDILDYKDRFDGKVKVNKSPEKVKVKVTAKVTEDEDDDSSDADEELNFSAKDKPFRFAAGSENGGNSSGSGSDLDLSDSGSDDERNTIVPDPPAAMSLTPTPGGLKLPKLRPNDSELDSPSSRVSESEKLEVEINSAEELETSNFQKVKAFHEYQYLTTLILEVHCAAQGDLTPNPEFDQILAIFYGFHTDSPNSGNVKRGYFVLDPSSQGQGSSNSNVEYFSDEISMLKRFNLLIQEYDPDILLGYEIQKFSWGYFIERGIKIGLDMLQELSRMLPPTYQNQNSESAATDISLDSWNESVSGRIVLNLWKLLRHEITVTSYTFESAVLHILHERVHRLSHQILSDFWTSGIPESKVKVIQYFQRRVEYTMKITEKLDLINRTSELARLFGIQFFEVLSRGSQFRVESMMLRLAKPMNLIPPSPNPQQRAKMKAPEYLPLIMEPESKFYTDPVAVLDFQSLYPSMMMAYNYCFSTCIGRVGLIGGSDEEFDLGCLAHAISPAELNSLISRNLVTISPCGVVFVKHSVKRGILGDMLEQILDTRQMVKRAMKKWKDDETLQNVLDSRQLGLKLIANVTYGYTSANYSGRMPCIEIADSVVSKGRETLQRAIDYVKENEAVFGGKVVYGDTDSLFVHFPGKTRAEAFVLAQKIVDDVTALNPKPVKLKLEKVYESCILQTKKRYVGFAYETPDQKEPKYDAKGIETVRRDGCPATAKILEGTLKILFTTKDPAAVKKFIVEQFRKIFLGRVSLSKYTFARVYRGRMGYRPGAVVASLEIAKKLAEKDPRAEPLTKERVPYIIVYGVPGSTLISRVRRPEEFIGNPNLRLNAHYYIEKSIIPALNRCLALAKLDVFKWYSEMPRRYLQAHFTESEKKKKGTIEQYFARENCIKCNGWTQTGFCDTCFSTVEELKEFLRKLKRDIVKKYEGCMKTCRNCSGEVEMTCINMSCSIKHKYLRYERDYVTKLPAIIKLRSNVCGGIDDLDW